MYVCLLFNFIKLLKWNLRSPSLFLIFASYSCNKFENSKDLGISNNYLEKNSIGYWHNEILSEVYPNFKSIPQTESVDINLISNKIVGILNSRNNLQLNKLELEKAIIKSNELNIEMGVSLNKSKD